MALRVGGLFAFLLVIQMAIQLLSIGISIVRPLVDLVVAWASSWGCYVAAWWQFKYTLQMRRLTLKAKSSKRSRRILECLDDLCLGNDELELIENNDYVRCAVLLSRRARIGLRYPKYSGANERIACDWIERHMPEGMTLGVRHRVLPLAIKLTFVKSQFETDAEHQFSWFKPMVENA